MNLIRLSNGLALPEARMDFFSLRGACRMGFLVWLRSPQGAREGNFTAGHPQQRSRAVERRYRCTLLALRPILFDSEVALSQAFSSQAFSRRTGRGREGSPWMLLFSSLLSGTVQTRSQLNWFPSPDVPVGFPGELTAESVLFFQPDPERRS